MTDAHGGRRQKWSPEWPLKMSRALVVNDNRPPNSPSVKMELLVFACATVLVVFLVEFHSTLGFWRFG